MAGIFAVAKSAQPLSDVLPTTCPPMWKNCLLILLAFLVAHDASALSIDRRPRPALLLRTGNFVAQDTPWSAALYTPAGVVLRRYSIDSLSKIEVSFDEKYLLLAGDDGELSVGDLQTGEIVWAKGSRRTGLGYIYDASFSGNGKFLAAGDYEGRAMVFETSSGARVGGVRFEPNQTGVMSVALSLDGATGVLIDVGEHVYTFDVASGTMRPTGLTGAWPVRFSSDGRHFAMRSNNSGTSEQLRVVTAADPMKKMDLGQFRNIGHIRPTADGKFNVTAIMEPEGDDRTRTRSAGFQCDPDVWKMHLVWTAEDPWTIEKKTDFDVHKMVGVSTKFNLLTSTFDLRNQTLLLTLDNRANYRRKSPRTVFQLAVLGVGCVGVIYVLVRVFRRRKRH